MRANSAFFCSTLRELVTVYHQIICALDIKVALAVEKSVIVVFGYDHKTVLFRHRKCLAQRAVNAIANRFF